MNSGLRAATLGVLGARVAYGAGLILAPHRLAQRWLGSATASAPTQVPLRGLGTREIVLHAGAIAAALRGAPLRPWLLGSIAGDLTDIITTVAGRKQLPEGAGPATAVVAGGSALLSLGLAIAADA